jgi:hypothetical protein
MKYIGRIRVAGNSQIYLSIDRMNPDANTIQRYTVRATYNITRGIVGVRNLATPIFQRGRGNKACCLTRFSLIS